MESTLPYGRDTRRCAQPCKAEPTEADMQYTTDSIAPTEFPKGRSAAREIEPEAAKISLHRPLERRQPTANHAQKSGYQPGLEPQESVLMVALPTIHRPQIWCPLPRTTTGLLIRLLSMGTATTAASVYRCYPTHAKKSDILAPDDMLTRVDVACKHPGNKLS